MKREDISRAAEVYAWRGDMYNLQTAFNAGADWRINSVWHDVGDRSIIIDNNEEVVLLLENGKIIEYDDDWEQYCCLVLKWAYKSDLTPTKKNNIWTT